MWYVIAVLLLVAACTYVARPPELAVITPEDRAKQDVFLQNLSPTRRTSSQQEKGGQEESVEGPVELPRNPQRKAIRTLEDWMEPVPDVERHTRKRQTRQRGTCSEFLNSATFANWLAKDKQTLLCLGLGGTGKSILASAVIDHLDENLSESKDIGVGFLYWESGEKPADLLWRLLKQFVQRAQKPLPETVQLFYKCYRLQKPLRMVTADVSQALQFMVMEYSKAFVVIDALDACERDEELDDFLSVIFELQETTRVNWLVLSRPIHDLENKFRGCPTLRFRAHDEDIQLYLAEALDKTPVFFRSDARLRSNVISAVVDASNGVFLLAYLHANLLKTVVSTDEISAILAQMLTSKPEQHTEEVILRSLSQACSHTMERMKQSEMKARHLAERILMWLSGSMAPLNLSEIAHSLSSEDDVLTENGEIPPVSTIIPLCAGLLAIGVESHRLSFHHHMIQKHFAQHQDIYFPNMHDVMTSACVGHLMATFQNGQEDANDKLNELSTQEGFTVYAAKHWGRHALLASEDATKTRVFEFLRDKSAVASFYQAMGMHNAVASVHHHQTYGMHVAAYFGLEEAVITLLKDEHGINSKDPCGKTPLLWAAEMGHTAIVGLLLQEADIEIECKDAQHRQTPLIWSAKHGYETIVRILLEHGANVDSKDGTFSQAAISWAVKNGHYNVAKLLLDSGADKIVKSLLEHGANVKLQNERYRALLSWAVQHCYYDTAQSLLEHGAPIPLTENFICPTLFYYSAEGCYEACTQQYLAQTPLISAAWNGHEDLVVLLWDHGYGLFGEDRAFKRNALSWAAMNGREAIVKLLLDKGYSASTRDQSQMTPLHYAALYGHREIAETLLERGADIDSRCDWYECTPLSLATWTGHCNVAQLLLDKGADVQASAPFAWALDNGPVLYLRCMVIAGEHIQCSREESVKMLQKLNPGDEHQKVLNLLLNGPFDFSGDSIDEAVFNLFADRLPILWGIWSRQDKMWKMLVEKGIPDLLDRDDESDTSALGEAAKNGFDILARLLIERGADIERRTTLIGKTPLHLAAENGHDRVVKVLLERGAGIEAQDTMFGQTPLMWAAEKGHLAVVELLLNEDAQIEAKDGENGQTSLLLAAKNGHTEVVKHLLERGADIGCKDTVHSLTALDWAQRNGYVDVERLLMKQSIGGSVP